ncbi:FRG domain-containing protein [Flavobacterium sp.]|uniref:FRG domain-containing protein n=1 Tax=Flavobacterium sp. TaxID=239 RepID=UPI00286E4FFC|nr:FRG domain-containing protein [Flavobacterium sp.]
MKDKIIVTTTDFDNIVSELRGGTIFESYWELFRGQSKNSYELKSGISRYAKTSNDIISLETNILKDFQDLVNQSKNPDKFIQLNSENLDYENNWRWLEQIQHYRLPTRLLDWTTYAKVALYFAVESNFEDDAQFWAFKSPLTWKCDEHFEVNPFEKNLDLISNSSFYIDEKHKDKIAEQRRAFQEGKFTIQDYSKSLLALEEQVHIKNRLIKYIIPADRKKYFLDYVKESNISEETIYVKYETEIEDLVSKIKTKYNFK